MCVTKNGQLQAEMSLQQDGLSGMRRDAAWLRASAGEASSHTLTPCMRMRRCIVAAGTGRGVFDGSVRVERAAQKTDAAQLSRNLLLVWQPTGPSLTGLLVIT